MAKSILPSADEILTQLTSEAVKHSDNLRDSVRDITLQALKARELNLEQIKSVLHSVTEGVSLGAASPKMDTEKALTEAMHGMDDALRKAVQASRLALEQFDSQGKEFTNTHVKTALHELKRLEDEFFATVKKASGAGSTQMKTAWGEVLKHFKFAGSDAGHDAMDTLEDFSNRMTATMHETRMASLKAVHTFNQNFATLASGILIGLSQALDEKTEKMKAAKPKVPATPAAKPKATAKAKPKPTAKKK
jgi:hypothetical protein